MTTGTFPWGAATFELRRLTGGQASRRWENHKQGIYFQEGCTMIMTQQVLFVGSWEGVVHSAHSCESCSLAPISSG